MTFMKNEKTYISQAPFSIWGGEMEKSSIERVLPTELLGPLNDIEEKYAPSELFAAGNKKLVQENRRISIIGTRNPSRKGAENAQKIVAFLVKNDVVIVSGLAKGIDTIAHKKAIEDDGRTIAVLGTPITDYYPKENKQLQDKIMTEHLVLSQFKTGSGIHPSHFPIRNRTMALISHASIIIEAGEKSGTMHQGWEALRLGRPLFIVEDLANNKELTWPSKLIDYGAEVLSMNNLDVILNILPEKGVTPYAHF
jgi:DNA processing protein